MSHHLVRLLLAAMLGGSVALGWTAYRIWDTGTRDERGSVDAIVVLGAAQYDGEPSPVLRAMNVPDEVLTSALRFSFGADTADLDEAIERITWCVAKARHG